MQSSLYFFAFSSIRTRLIDMPSARAPFYGLGRPFHLCRDEIHGHAGLDQGFEAGVLYRGPFLVAVFGHGNSPCSLARQHNGNISRRENS